MKKIVAFFLAATLSAALFTGCGEQADTSSTGSGDASTTAALSGTVKLSGSTSMEKISKALAERFSEKHSGVAVDVQLGGSSVGVQDAQSGKSDIGNVSRELKDTETGLTANKIAIDGIAVIVNKDNKVEGLTKDQLIKIYTGEISNWKDVGGADQKITVIGREASSGTRGAFEEILKVEDKCQYAQEKTETGAVKTAVQTTPAAIGYVSLEAVDDSIRTLKLDGVAPEVDKIKDGSYALARPFIMATKEGETLRPEVQAFLDFVLSDEGQKICTDNALISVK